MGVDDGDEDRECGRCHETMHIPPGAEPSEFCHDCAHSLVDELRARVAELEADAERFAWVLPIVSGDDDVTADAHAMALALHLGRNLTGRAAIDAAMRDAGNKSAQCFSTEGEKSR